jgi:hypothetical protein
MQTGYLGSKSWASAGADAISIPMATIAGMSERMTTSSSFRECLRLRLLAETLPVPELDPIDYTAPAPGMHKK